MLGRLDYRQRVCKVRYGDRDKALKVERFERFVNWTGEAASGGYRNVRERDEALRCHPTARQRMISSSDADEAVSK